MARRALRHHVPPARRQPVGLDRRRLSTEADSITTDLVVTVTLSEPTSAAQTVSVSTENGTATASGPGVADDDYDTRRPR